MKASMLIALIGARIGQKYPGGATRSMHSLRNLGGVTGAWRSKVAGGTYGKHTCVSTPEQIRKHNELVNTRQVMRFRYRKPDHPSNATYA